MRTCVGCRSKKSPEELIRLSLQGEHNVSIGGNVGRGAWLCPTIACFNTANKRRALPRALRSEISSEALETLRIAIVEGTVLSVDGPFVKR